MAKGNVIPSELMAGGFGKLPRLPEFIRVNARGRELLSMDQWLQEGLYHIRQEVGSEWSSLYDMRLFHRFVYRSDNSAMTVLGVIRAAMDAAGRRFPFVVFTLMPTRFVDAYPLLIPAVLDHIFGHLEQTIEDVKSMDDTQAIRKRLEVPCPLTLPTVADEERYQAFLDDTLCSEMGRFGPERSLTIMNYIAAALGRIPMHPRRIPVGFEFPLAHSPYARGLEIRFWIELCMILLNWYPPTLSLFWYTGVPSPRTSSLIVYTHQPPGHALGAMLVQDGPVRGVWRPEQNQALTIATGQASTHVRAEAHYPLRWVLELLSPGYPGTCRWYQPGEVTWR